MSSSEGRLSDDELATLLESKARSLREDDGDDHRQHVVRGILKLLADEPYVRERGQVYDDGRTSFGRDVSGDGLALFLPDVERGEA